jgi:hypothetical protein
MLPTSTRKAGIAANLAYADKQWHELAAVLRNPEKANPKLPEFVAQTAGVILQKSIECFDLFGKDLFEAFVIPSATEKQKAEFFKSGEFRNAKLYFPFYETQLQSGRPYFVFKSLRPDIYFDLSEFTTAVHSVDRVISNYGLPVRRLLEARELVNSVKHHDVYEFTRHQGEIEIMKFMGNSKIFIDSNTRENAAKILGGTADDIRVTIAEEGVERNEVEKLTAYRFSTGSEVTDLCLFTIYTTAQTLEHFYRSYYADPATSVVPTGVNWGM